jgi:hypothetical protein
LNASIAAWKPCSCTGAKTGTMPKLKHSRVTRPIASENWCAPWNRVSLSN